MSDQNLLVNEKTFELDINCPRCGEKHPAIKFNRFAQPRVYTHWATCPKLNEPIILKFNLGDSFCQNLRV